VRTHIWFGIPGVKMQWCPAPLAGAEASNANFVESIAFENGGADVSRSKQYRKEYNFAFTGLSQELDGIGVYNKYASGFYGDGLFQFADPYAFETNLFPAGWASPGLIEQGWENIFNLTPTFSATSTNAYNQPVRKATWAVQINANTVPPLAHSVLYIPIPPTHTLHIGASGTATGSAVLRVRPVNTDNTLDTAVDLTLLADTSATRMNATFAGSSYQAVKIYITRSSSSLSPASTITLTSMMARLVETGRSLTLTGDHAPGEGHTGLEFADDARVETYTYMYPPRKGLSTTLVEVGAWR
jgi:hypothetical protein